jgi:hypothetical protein
MSTITRRLAKSTTATTQSNDAVASASHQLDGTMQIEDLRTASRGRFSDASETHIAIGGMAGVGGASMACTPYSTVNVSSG